ncbi:hypothetical protein Dda_7753 [Drechslerella dactyloides]|uniref:Uncharacterized protein n=1 Tax=Drechslerella dactyloides TaxID=74499 RepID=A0AAD6NIL4_DREDA|nr:hypothetical protein Dda_7753 [Drechslerella dactyloides]
MPVSDTRSGTAVDAGNVHVRPRYGHVSHPNSAIPGPNPPRLGRSEAPTPSTHGMQTSRIPSVHSD